MKKETHKTIMDSLFSSHESWEGNEEQETKQKEIVDAMNEVDSIVECSHDKPYFDYGAKCGKCGQQMP